MIDLDRLIREADPAHDLSIPQGDVRGAGRIMGGSSRRRRRIGEASAVAVAIAVAAGVVVLALSAGGPRHRGVGAASPSSVSRSDRPLREILGVLRRPQTRADRTALPARLRGSYETGLVRLAAVTPWGDQVILAPQRGNPSATLSIMVRSSAYLTIPGQHPKKIRPVGAALGFTAAQIKVGQAVLLEGPGSGPFGGWRGARLYMAVPDGVARVAFDESSKPDLLDAPAVSVPVHDNVAFAQLKRTCCAWTVVARWYSAQGELIRVTGTAYGPGLTELDVLRADGIGTTSFGAHPREVRAAINSLLAQDGTLYSRGGSCGLDHQIKWWDEHTPSGEPALTVYFRRSAFVGYEVGDPIAPRKQTAGWALATGPGLRVGAPLARARSLYGSRFAMSAAQGGSWSVRTPEGSIRGYAWPPGSGTGVEGRSIATIEAGDVGCPAVAP